MIGPSAAFIFKDVKNNANQSMSDDEPNLISFDFFMEEYEA